MADFPMLFYLFLQAQRLIEYNQLLAFVFCLGCVLFFYKYL